MSEPETMQIVRKAIGEVLGVAPETIAGGDDLVDSYNVDSLELMEIGVRIERALGVRIDVDQIRDVRTPNDVVAYVATLPSAPHGVKA